MKLELRRLHTSEEKRVYDKIHRQFAMINKWKIIKTRWIDINKGDDDNPVYRSRLVGKEFNDGQMDGLFAATPPLEALRFLVHEAATVRSNEAMGSKVIMVNDVARAFFEAPAIRNVCIDKSERIFHGCRRAAREGWTPENEPLPHTWRGHELAGGGRQGDDQDRFRAW